MIAVLSIIALSACKPKEAVAEQKTGDGKAGAQSASMTAQDKLAKLGFHVFPSPIDLPDFSAPSLDSALRLKDSDVETLSRESLRGTITVLNFWATWCPPCRKEMPSIDRLQKLMAGYQFRIAAVNTGEKGETVNTFIDDAGYSFPVYLDESGTLGAVLASQGIPTTYILDKSGRAIAGIVGSREYDDPELVAILRELSEQ